LNSNYYIIPIGRCTMNTFPALKATVFFVTGNIHKFNEACQVLRTFEISTVMVKRISVIEAQFDTIEEIAERSVLEAVQKTHLPVFVEDAGLFIKALNGFPGPYSSYVFRTIGNKAILKLMHGLRNRKATFKSAIAYSEPGMKKAIMFLGKIDGELLNKEQGNRGFGFDPIFQPNFSSKSFAEMTLKEKNRQSHRALALRNFAEWYTLKPRTHKS
jgi:XTP/dITP diphosphohydrolase